MKKLLSFLFITVFVLVLTACGGGGGGGGGSVAGGPSSDDGSSAVGSSVSYSPGYTYYVPAIYQDNSYTGYFLRYSVGDKELLPALTAATGFSTIDQNTANNGSQASGKRFVQNTENWPMPKVASSSQRRLLASVQPKTYALGDTEQFWVITDFNNETSQEKTFTLKQIGSHCRVWYDNDDPNNLDNEQNNQLAIIKTKLEAMFAVETALCGSMVPTRTYSNVIPITSETKLEIVVYAMTDSYLGYFYPRDLMTDNAYSNKAPVIYITSTDTTSNMYSTVSHEFDHLLNFIQKDINLDKRQATWYTELMSNTIEEVLESFNDVDNAHSVRTTWMPAFLFYYNHGLLWNQLNSNASYSNVYAFGAWLVRNYGGPELFHKIATNAYVNEESIVQAVRSMGYNETFVSLRKKFAESLIYTVAGCGRPNFNKGINTTFAGENIVMPAIDLMTIQSLSTDSDKYNYASANKAACLVNCTEGQPYYGPLILKPTAHFENVCKYGFEIQKLGTGLTQVEIPSNYYGAFDVEFK